MPLPPAIAARARALREHLSEVGPPPVEGGLEDLERLLGFHLLDELRKELRPGVVSGAYERYTAAIEDPEVADR